MRNITAGKLAALLAPYAGAVPTVDPLRERGALSARIAASAAGMTLEAHREHCRNVISDMRPIRVLELAGGAA